MLVEYPIKSINSLEEGQIIINRRTGDKYRILNIDKLFVPTRVIAIQTIILRPNNIFDFSILKKRETLSALKIKIGKQAKKKNRK